MNAKEQGLVTLSRAAEVTADTLSALKKSIDNLLGSDMEILVHDNQMISDRQKEFLIRLIKQNFIDPAERQNKIEEVDSYSKADADLAIKQLLGQ